MKDNIDRAIEKIEDLILKIKFWNLGRKSNLKTRLYAELEELRHILLDGIADAKYSEEKAKFDKLSPIESGYQELDTILKKGEQDLIKAMNNMWRPYGKTTSDTDESW